MPYDAGGNRTLKQDSGARTTFVYDAASRIVYSQDGTGRTTYTFDANGNQSRQLSPAGSRTTSVWDYENMNTGIRRPNGTRTTITYDGLLRVMIHSDTGYYYYDGGGRLQLLTNSGGQVPAMGLPRRRRIAGQRIGHRRCFLLSWGITQCRGRIRSCRITVAPMCRVDRFSSRSSASVVRRYLPMRALVACSGA